MRGDNLVKPARVADSPIKGLCVTKKCLYPRDPYRTIHCLWRYTK
ncbi:hypothetical protein FWK35_00022708 [Aphis craccivora]|uniref:Uncharacterized protein n=1 Tax=Aphis craccivora TaxID=307492 RepID=A0A6G0YW30_APHCR|nr:hypothetical protein FWK35_00022708 [Aphis craccivora]